MPAVIRVCPLFNSYLANGFFQAMWQHVTNGGFSLRCGLWRLKLIRVRAPVCVDVLLEEQCGHLSQRGRTVRLQGQLSQQDTIF